MFTDPVYNYTREFPYLWEEIVLPIAYTDDRQLVEQILLRAARDHAVVDDPSANGAFESMRRRYALAPTSLNPSVYWRITDNWVELSLRFLVPHRGVRAIKDLMTRDILAGLDEAGIGIASATNAIVGIPDLKIVDARRDPDAHQ
ncbi:hypothetical protein MTX35_09455 [Rhodococcus sp. ARC_M12]|nr:hypothetical protein [Rhodococcus sp. ARC_M12]